ncbi:MULTISPECIES: EAL domain-containing protein [unclassified Actinopolyspora]|uniref:EAL domain-containing protein n=1 Tax=unclassified Actinopolyspora TaxID=2639451 RepID=UPI0013F64EF9|nr:MULTISPECIES: EAL domain-containing protein [unclassified Actinopolyspora]NHD18720.1 EAL domain-containing protein [Actinopolyspora sp. BKK2]NHE77958.1 EAL domain-containing protein [Actinopolyspora sp. BKK1]
MSGTDHGNGLRADGEKVIGAFGSSLLEYAVYTLDPDGVVSSWNPGAERLTGAPADEVVGQNISIFYTSEQNATGYPRELLRRAVESGSCTDEGWRIRKDGSRFWASVVTTALWSSEGRLRGFARLTRDETDLHTQLERSLRQFHDLFVLTPIGIGVYDRYGYLVDSNLALCGLLGYSPEQMSGAHVTDFVHPDEPDKPKLLESFGAGAPPGRAPVREMKLLRSDGQQLICELHIAKSVRPEGDEFWMVVCQDVTERNRRVEEWRYWATHDELTGLPNRQALDQLLADADMSGSAMLYCDITDFRRINESLGLRAGDELLMELAKRMRGDLPEGWLVARLASDEYLVVCPDVVGAGGVEVVVTLVTELLHRTVHLRDHPPIQIAASVGVAIAESSDSTIDELLRSAGAAVMEVKRGNRERFAVASTALIESMDRQVQLESELRTALENEDLALCYQPIVDGDGVIRAAEALVRWWHPERGKLTPGFFLPVAERGGLLRKLDRYVLRAALREAVSWPPRADGGAVRASINLGALSPGDPELLDVLDEVVAETGIAWGHIVLELVETSLINLSARGLEVMSELAERGVRFAVDDFGTGYSSLARLKELPIEIIKVDRGFVAEVARDSTDLHVVRAIVDLATAIGCRCTAEGVETLEQFEALRGVGVLSYQGWLFSYPVRAGELRSLLESGSSCLPEG